jgi:tripartite ATP-independent transporter DctP family solute receptor
MSLKSFRRQFLLGAAAGSGVAMLGAPAVLAARTTVIRLGIDLAQDHPTVKAAVAAGAEIKKKSNGEIDLQVFPNNQLGDDTHMLSNLRAGGMQMMGIGDNILATLAPSAAIDNVGFAFKDAQTAWAALDGKVGDIVRAEIAKLGLQPMHHIWDQGFREITSSTRPINTPQDLQGFKMRVPPSPISLAIFRGLGSAPATLNSAELYTALQTHVVDGQENPLGIIETQKFYQVQKYCSMTNHMWVGYWMLVNGAFWQGLPAEHRKIVADAFDAQADTQRTANEQLNNSLEATLTQQGLIFNKPDVAPFRETLVKSGFYKEWQGKFGTALWSALEQYTGARS